jgi:integrase
MKNRAGCVSKYTTKSGDRLWRYRFDADPVDGKRRQVSQAGFATRAAAMKACGDAIAEYERSKALPVPAPPSRETVADWLRVWVRDYAPQRCTPVTVQRYSSMAGYILQAENGELARLANAPLVEADNVLIEAAMFELLRIPAKRAAHLSAMTVRDVAAVLRTALNKAFRLGKIDVNPVLRCELPRVPHHEAVSMTTNQMRALKDACMGDWTHCFIELALASGCRRGELLALTWPDVDTLTVSKSLEYSESMGLRVKRPKNNRIRKFRIGQTAITALRFLREEQEQHRRLYGADYQDNGLIFCNADGSYRLPNLVSATIARRLKKAGIEGCSLHTTRHSHASHLLSKGVPLTAVSARLGHANVAITAQIYSHALPDDDTRAADAWETVEAPVDREKNSFVTSCDIDDSPQGVKTTVSN